MSYKHLKYLCFQWRNFLKNARRLVACPGITSAYLYCLLNCDVGQVPKPLCQRHGVKPCPVLCLELSEQISTPMTPQSKGIQMWWAKRKARDISWLIFDCTFVWKYICTSKGECQHFMTLHCVSLNNFLKKKKKPVVCFNAYSIINSTHYFLSMYHMPCYCGGTGYITVNIFRNLQLGGGGQALKTLLWGVVLLKWKWVMRNWCGEYNLYQSWGSSVTFKLRRS